MGHNQRHLTVTMDALLRRPLTRRGALQGAAAAGVSAVALNRLGIRESVAADASTLVVASGADAVTLDPHV
ncbi:MAG: hypothetical protein KC442_01725 [Thermomicrobiales bacterium]|nr:hypothetical protein [Thermomicrobiales bacterium]